MRRICTMCSVFILNTCLLTLLLSPMPLKPQEVKKTWDMKKIAIEDLLNTNITTASEKKQPIKEAPANIYVMLKV